MSQYKMGNVNFYGYQNNDYALSISAVYDSGKSFGDNINSGRSHAQFPLHEIDYGSLRTLRVILHRVRYNCGVDYYFTGNGDRQGSLIVGQDVVLPTSPSNGYDFYLVDVSTKRKIS